MNRVYFSNKQTTDNWSVPDVGQIQVFLVPTKWWSIKEWKMARMFQRDFECTFIEEKTNEMS